ncbi:MAG: LytTR family transcriptional regulator DNA-binding domain-containing protein [Pirellulaceae bacterium]
MDALSEINAKQPDVAFLDIQMPKLSGFDVVYSLDDSSRTQVVFVTAYDQFAVEAFDVSAVDYLLKPVDRKRFQECLQRIVRKIEQERSRSVALEPPVRSRLSDVQPCRQLLVRRGGEQILVNVNEIAWVESANKNVVLHLKSGQISIRRTIRGLAENLQGTGIVRIHRQTLVQVSEVQRISAAEQGDYRVILMDGTELTMSRKYKSDFDRLFEV